MQDPTTVVQLLVSLAMLALEGGFFVFFLVLTILSFRELRRTWKVGVLFALVALVLGLPSVILGIYYFDVQRFAPGTDPALAPAIKVFAGIVAAGLVLLMGVVRVMYYHVAAVEWSRVWGAGRPTIINRSVATWPGTLVGSGAGAMAAVASLVLFRVLAINESTQMAQFASKFPGLSEVPAAIAVPTSLGVGIAAAIVEELVFRGGILGFLCRITKNRTVPAWLWIVITAALWAFLHYDNTDRPGLKMGQIFLIGLAFGWMARRWGLHASMAGHIMLNVVVVLVAAVTNFS